MLCTTSMGLAWNITDPDPNDVHIEDIAHALSLQCRFNGHVHKFYSVAEHSVRVAREIALRDGIRSQILAGLLHDAAEAYMGDLITPIKMLYPQYEHLERITMDVILEGLGLSYINIYGYSVRRADKALLATEARDLMPKSWFAAYYANLPDSEELDPLMLHDTIVPWTADYARCQFLDKYLQLTKEAT